MIAYLRFLVKKHKIFTFSITYSVKYVPFCEKNPTNIWPGQGETKISYAKINF